MPGDGKKVNVHFVDVDGHLSESLGSICVEKGFISAADVTDLFKRLDDTDFVVDVNH